MGDKTHKTDKWIGIRRIEDYTTEFSWDTQIDGIIRVFFAFLQCSRMEQGENPFGSQLMWDWVSQMINRNPEQKWTALVLSPFFEVYT